MAKLIIQHVVVHELLKEANKDFDHSKPYNLRNDELDKNNPIVQDLVKKVVDLYGTKGNSAHYGIFQNKDDASSIPKQFNNYYSLSTSDSANFILLTREIMKKMYHAAKSESWSSGGYVVFSDYISQDVRYLLVTMIKKTNGVTISADLEPEEMIHLEMNNINQAAKINFSLYKQFLSAEDDKKTELSYLSFISKTTGQSAAAYFISALGCDKGTASAGATRKLPNEAKKFFSKHAESMNHADSLRNHIIAYMEKQLSAERSAKLCDVESLVSSKLNFLEEEKRNNLVEEFIKHLNSEEIQVPIEFVINKNSLDKIRNVIFKDPNSQYSFNFDKDLLGTNSDAKVYYDDDNGNLTFSDLPVQAKTKIKQALREMGLGPTKEN